MMVNYQGNYNMNMNRIQLWKCIITTYLLFKYCGAKLYIERKDNITGGVE